VTNIEHFIKLIQEINLQNEGLFTNILMEEVLQVITNRLNTDPSFPECSPLQVEDVMELLDICLTTTYFQFEDKFYPHKRNYGNGRPNGSVNMFTHAW
jgi:hypothetical protein